MKLIYLELRSYDDPFNSKPRSFPNMAAQIVALDIDGKHNDRNRHGGSGSSTQKDGFGISLEETFDSNPFGDPEVAAHYRAIYEEARYECRDAFDPSLEWTSQEERRIVRKLDWHVCTWAVCLLHADHVFTHADAYSASCFLPFKSTAAISVKLYPTTC